MEKVSNSRVKELHISAPKSGIAVISLVNPKKTGSITIRDYYEGDELRPYVNEKGGHRILRVKKSVFLDLSKINDRLTYEQVRLHPIYTNGSNPSLKVVNKEAEAEMFVLKKDLEAQANDIIQKLKKTELQDFSRVLLVTVRVGSSETVLKQSLYQLASENPSDVVNAWNDEDREFKVVIRNCIEQKIITKTHGVFRFKGETIGTSFELAVEWLKTNEDLIPSLRKELK